MVKVLLQPINNKRAVSEMVSYVLLITIAVGLSIAVYSFLMLYIPKDQVLDCGSDINLAIVNASCSSSTGRIYLQVSNKGLFKIDGMYARFNKDSKKVRFLLDQDTRFKYDNKTIQSFLLPGENFFRTYLWPPASQVPATSGNYILEVQAAKMTDKGKLAVCKDAIVTLPISCS